MPNDASVWEREGLGVEEGGRGREEEEGKPREEGQGEGEGRGKGAKSERRAERGTKGQGGLTMEDGGPKRRLQGL